jgi:hypothetical protein
MSGPSIQSSNNLFAGSFQQHPGLLPSGANTSFLSGVIETAGNISNQGTDSAIADHYLRLLQSNEGITDLLKRNRDLHNDKK